jgi:hypothetical protein
MYRVYPEIVRSGAYNSFYGIIDNPQAVTLPASRESVLVDEIMRVPASPGIMLQLGKSAVGEFFVMNRKKMSWFERLFDCNCMYAQILQSCPSSLYLLFQVKE